MSGLSSVRQKLFILLRHWPTNLDTNIISATAELKRGLYINVLNMNMISVSRIVDI